MDGRVGTQSIMPQQYSQYLDVVESNSDGGIILGTCDRTSRLWHCSLWYYLPTSSGEELQDASHCGSAVGLQTGVNDVVFVSNKIIVAACDSGSVACWEVNDDQEPFLPLWEAREHDHLVSSLAFYEKQQHVISAGYDGIVKIWVLDDDVGNCSHTYKGHSDIIYTVDHHQTKPIFITCSMDGYVIVWDTRQPKPAHRYENLSPGPVCVRWQPGTEHTIAVGDSSGSVEIRDLRSTDSGYLKRFKEFDRPVNVLEFSPHCPSLLATGGENSTVRLFDLDHESGKSVYTYNHKDYIRSAAWRSATELLTASYEGKLAMHSGDKWNHNMELNGVTS